MKETRKDSKRLACKKKLNKISSDGSTEENSEDRIDVSDALWDQGTYLGRLRQMFFISDIRTLFVPELLFKDARNVCMDYASGQLGPSDVSKEEIIYAKKLYDSGFHPETDEMLNFFGRMSFQIPGNAILLMAMMTLYKSTAALLGLQVINQAFSTIFNYENRSIKSIESDIFKAEKKNTLREEAFLCGSLASCVTTLGLKKLFYCRGTILARLVPLGGLTIGNMVNLSVMRQKEIMKGIAVSVIDEDPFMDSKVAGVKASAECFTTRLLAVTPTMVMIPMVGENIKSSCMYYRHPWILFPIELGLCLASLLVLIPTSMALYPWCNSMKPELLEMCEDEYNEYLEKIPEEKRPDKIYYNKGL